MGSGPWGGPFSPPHLLIKVKHWPGCAAGSLGLGGPGCARPSLDLSFLGCKAGFSCRVRWQVLLS